MLPGLCSTALAWILLGKGEVYPSMNSVACILLVLFVASWSTLFASFFSPKETAPLLLWSGVLPFVASCRSSIYYFIVYMVLVFCGRDSHYYTHFHQTSLCKIWKLIRYPCVNLPQVYSVLKEMVCLEIFFFNVPS